MMETNNNKLIVTMSIVVVIMTLLGYVGGILSHNIMLFKDNQKECYDWLEVNCPCIFPEKIVPTAPNYNLTIGGQNETAKLVQEETQN